jgi:hypothetical protein
MLGDFLLSFSSNLIDTKFYMGNKFVNFCINLSVYAPLIIATIVLLVIKRKKPCVIAGFLYLIGGIIIWMYKIVYLIYLIISEELETDYETPYSEYFYLISFLLNLVTIFFRLMACYLVKKLFSDVCKLEDYIHEREHAEFIQSLGTQNAFDPKLYEDEEITEEKLYEQSKNPFITGREKKEDNEEEEIVIESTL